MEVFDAVRTLLAVRDYQDKPLPAEIVRRIVEAGRLTGSSMNRQPWHFIVVENRDRLRQLGALAKTGPYIAQAALAIVVAIQRTPFSVSDGSRAIQSMMLTAWSEGVGSNWVGFMGLIEIKPLLGIPEDLAVPIPRDPLHGHRKTFLKPSFPAARNLRFRSAGGEQRQDVLAIIPFGYPARPVGKGRKNRKPLFEVAHRERFEQPF